MINLIIKKELKLYYNFLYNKNFLLINPNYTLIQKYIYFKKSKKS